MRKDKKKQTPDDEMAVLSQMIEAHAPRRPRSKATGSKKTPPSMFSPPSIRAIKIPLHLIRPNPDQPRVEFDEDGLKSLARSMEEHGLLQPITVIDRGDQYEEKPYVLISGERRFRAAERLGWEKIDAIVLTDDELKADLKTLALIENTQRKNLTPVELAEAVWEQLYEFYPTVEDLKEATNRLRAFLRRGEPEEEMPDLLWPLYNLLSMAGIDLETWRRHALKTLDWPEELRRAVKNRELPYTRAAIVAKFPNERFKEALEAAKAGATEKALRAMLKEAQQRGLEEYPQWRAFKGAYMRTRAEARRMRQVLERANDPEEVIRAFDRVLEAIENVGLTLKEFADVRAQALKQREDA